MELDATDQKLIDHWQRGFPLEPTPFARIAASLAVSEDEVLQRLQIFKERGIISRVGAAVRPNTVAASTLAAISAPREQIEGVAAAVNQERGVNHNYEREHAYNLWFVVTGADRAAVDASLARIEKRTGYRVLDLPLEKSFHIDLGFPVFSEGARERTSDAKPWVGTAWPSDAVLLSALEDGLPLVPRPFMKIAQKLECTEAEVIADLTRMSGDGIITRFGLIVRHRNLGFNANAMVVWDIVDTAVDAVAENFCRHPFVTLCYQRPRRLPHWRYNLFCMIHGRDRSVVSANVALLRELAQPCSADSDILFSTRCFRQRGPRLTS